MPAPTIRMFKKGDVLMREGEAGDCAYVIEKGSVEILVRQQGALIQIGTRGQGSLIGEMAMIDDKPRTATVRALEDCEAMEISRDSFSRRVEAADPVLRMVMRVIMTRYRDLIARAHAVSFAAPGTSAAETHENANETHDIALGAIKIHNELKHALDAGELTLFYQPIIDFQTMGISGFEALMRWKHPQRGMISPGVFIPVAEESGFIVELSQWALGVSCDAAHEMKKAASGAAPFVSVNFSVKDFSGGGFFDHIKDTLQKHGAAPSQIRLEITESLLMEEPERAKAALEKCRDLGVGVSIDDFGSGYSSLSYLHNFPIDTLKIDQSFIRAMTTHAQSRVLVRSIIGLARNLGMRVVAEGIETEEEARILRGMDCDKGQGYLFARPMPLEDALKLLKDRRLP